MREISHYEEYLEQRNRELKAEVERLRALLSDAPSV